MKNLNDKYFESVIAALKKEKEAENFIVPQDFRSSLRAKLLERGDYLGSTQKNTGEGFLSFINKWKYWMGAVPTALILTLVAANAFNTKLTFPSQEYLPVENYSSQKEAPKSDLNIPINEEKSFSGDSIDPGIETFSAEKALPPADILKAYLERNSGGESINTEVKKDAGKAALPQLKLNDSRSDLQTLKISSPVPNTVFNEVKNELNTVNADSYYRPPVSNFENRPVNSFKVNPVNTIRGNNQSYDNVQIVEDGASGRSSVEREVVPVNLENSLVNQVNDSSLVNAETPVIQDIFNAVSPQDTNLMNEIVPESGLNAQPINSQTNFTIEQPQNTLPKPNSVEVIAPLQKNSSEGTNQIINSTPIIQSRTGYSGELDVSKINYSGNDLDLMVALIKRDFSGALKVCNSNNYYFEVINSGDSTLKIDFSVDGKLKKWVLYRLYSGLYVKVTEMNF